MGWELSRDQLENTLQTRSLGAAAHVNRASRREARPPPSPGHTSPSASAPGAQRANCHLSLGHHLKLVEGGEPGCSLWEGGRGALEADLGGP